MTQERDAVTIVDLRGYKRGLYKVSARNSTVNGGPGRLYDWSRFCWDGSAIHVHSCGIAGHPEERDRAPLPFKDGYLIAEHCEYLHVPYNWEEQGAIYRVRPNDSMYSGQVYHGRRILFQRAVLVNRTWFWELEWERP